MLPEPINVASTDSELKMLSALVDDAVRVAAMSGVSHSCFHGFRVDAWRRSRRTGKVSVQVCVTYGSPPGEVGRWFMSIPRGN